MFIKRVCVTPLTKFITAMQGGTNCIVVIEVRYKEVNIEEYKPSSSIRYNTIRCGGGADQSARPVLLGVCLSMDG